MYTEKDLIKDVANDIVKYSQHEPKKTDERITDQSDHKRMKVIQLVVASVKASAIAKYE